MRKITIILLSLVLSSFSKEHPQNDLKEYGLNGKVKAVYTTNYLDLEKADGKWIENQNFIVSKSIMFFNKNGNISKILEMYPLPNSVIKFDTALTIEFSHKNERKVAYSKSYYNLKETGKYTWLNKKNYKLIATREDGLTITSYSKLSRKFRDLSGNYKYQLNDSIVLNESYKNTLNRKNQIIKSVFTDSISGKKRTIEFEILELDKNNNITKLAQTDSKTEKLKKYSTRTYEYFE